MFGRRGRSEAEGPVELTLLTGTVEANVQAAQGVADAFNDSQDDVVVTLDSSVPSGSEGDNLLKTRLATGEMTDMFWYNSGSLFQALALTRLFSTSVTRSGSIR